MGKLVQFHLSHSFAENKRKEANAGGENRCFAAIFEESAMCKKTNLPMIQADSSSGGGP